MMEPVKKDGLVSSFDNSSEIGRDKSHEVGETHEFKVIESGRDLHLLYSIFQRLIIF